MITFSNVTKTFPDGTEAIKGVNVTIPEHQLTAIIGPSGCGKTTLMRMINRLEVPTTGDVLIDGESIAKRDAIELRRSIGYVIQRIGLIPHMTIEENIAVVPELLNWSKADTKARVEELLQMVGLPPKTFKKRYPIELSGGQQQRVGVSRALASNPNIILMDEPFSALDPISREQLQKKLRELQEEIQKTIVFVTHDMDEALEIADFIIVMRDGKVEQTGTPQELLNEQANEFVRTFIGKERIMRKVTFHTMPVGHLSAYLHKNPPINDSDMMAEVSADMLIEEVIKKMGEVPQAQLAVVEDGQVLGYLTYPIMLEAFIAIKEGVAST